MALLKYLPGIAAPAILISGAEVGMTAGSAIRLDMLNQGDRVGTKYEGLF